MTQPCTLYALFLLLMTTGPARGEEQNREDDIVQFWNTSELIWTTSTTSMKAQLCKVDLKVDISQNNITFYRALIKSREWHVRKYNGTFRDYYKKYDSVKIQSTDRRDKAREVLQYRSKDSTCAVIWVVTSNEYRLTPSYDLRIKDSYIKKHTPNNSECWQQFLNVTRGRKYRRMYHRGCHAVFYKRVMSSTSMKGHE
uniref:Lipocalin n=1 Tax=Rhipicephalus appendiculatus TaxID=34631 RepID=A0A131Z6Y0_RHIAP